MTKPGSSTPLVALFQPVLSHYRVDLFNELDDVLDSRLTLFTVDAAESSRLGGGESRLTVRRRLARTFKAGPLWFVPATLLEVWSRRWDVVVLSWNARQVELTPALLLARWRRVPVVLWGHGFGRNRSRWATALRRWQARQATLVVTYSEAGVRDVEAIAPEAWVDMVLNTTGRAAPDEGEVLVEVNHRVAYLSRLLAAKQADLLVEAIARLRDDGLVIGLDLIGDGPHRPVVESAVERSGLGDQVTWHGQLTDWARVRTVLAGCDLVVIPSNAGLAVVDAFAAGRGAVVVDDRYVNGPEAELVVDGETGLRYAPATAGALADRLASAYSHQEVLREVSEAAIACYRKRLTRAAAAGAFAGLIREVHRS